MIKLTVELPEGGYAYQVPHFTIAEAHKETGISIQSIRKRAREGKIDAVFIQSRYFISLNGLDQLRKESFYARDRVGVPEVKNNIPKAGFSQEFFEAL